MAKVLVVGSANTDMVVQTNRFPDPGETLLGGAFHMFPGGKGANQAVAAARMGAPVTFVCALGDDLFGRNALEGYSREGIDTSWVQTLEGMASGVALITVNASGENEIVVAPGANSGLTPAHLEGPLTQKSNWGVALTQLETPLEVVAFLAKSSRASGVPLILNPAPAAPLPDDLLQGLFCITPNQTEAAALTGLSVCERGQAIVAASALLAKGVRNVVITLGKEGCYYAGEDGAYHLPSEKVTAVDTTAAGDVFNGVLAAGTAEGLPWKERLHRANRAAALSVTRLGAQSSAPYKNEIS